MGIADRTVVVRLKGMVQDFQASMARAGASIKDVDQKMERLPRKHKQGFQDLSQGALVMGGAVAVGFGFAVKATMAFDKQMSSVGAAAGATGKQLMDLRAAALQAGADTAFSATQAAKAQEELAKAGISVQDILGGGLKGALDLAAAGQLDLGQAAEIAATAMVQFKREGKDVPHIADLLSAGANKAQGTVEDMGMALKQGGLVAGQFGISLEETTGGLAAFASAGLLGSDAGTSMKTMLLRLANPAAETAELMDRLGINAYDASGQFVGLAGLADQLRSKLSGLTQEQRNAAMAQIFGTDAIRAANVLYDEGAAGIKEWTDKVDDSGNAARTAAAKMDNLAGDVERLKGSLETALIQQGSGATGVLRTLAKAAENTVTSFAGMPPAAQSTATVLGLTVGAALAAAGAYGVMVPKIRDSRAALVALGPAGKVADTALSKTAGAAGKLVAILAVLQVAQAIFGGESDVAHVSTERLAKDLDQYGRSGKLAGDATDVLGTKVKDLGFNLGFLDKSGIAPVGTAIAKLSEFFYSDFADSIKRGKEHLKALDDALAQMVTSGNPDEAQRAFDRIAIAAAKQGVSVAELRKGLPGYVSAMKDAKDKGAEAGRSMETTGGQARILAGGLAGAVKEAGDLAKVLSGLNDVNIDSLEAQIAYQTSLNSMTGRLRENKSAWHGVSTAALENQQIVIDQTKAASERLVKQYEQIKASQGEAAANTWATKTHGVMREAILRAATAAGINRNAVASLVDQIFRLPAERKTNIRADTAQASAAVKRLQDQLLRLVNRQYAAVIAGRLDYFGMPIRAQGGMLPGPVNASQRKDNGIFFGQSGEWVTPVDRTRQYMPELKAINEGTLQRRADGGMIGSPWVVRTHADVSRASAFTSNVAKSAQLMASGGSGRFAKSPGGWPAANGNNPPWTSNVASAASGVRRAFPGQSANSYVSAYAWSDHYPKAIDFMTNAGSPGGLARGNAITAFLAARSALYGLKYLIWNGKYSSGSGWGPYSVPGQGAHTDHVHASFFDSGGTLEPGWNSVYNGLGRQERLVPDAGQMTATAAPVIHNHFYIDGQEIRGITRAEIGAWSSDTSRRLSHGRR